MKRLAAIAIIAAAALSFPKTEARVIEDIVEPIPVVACEKEERFTQGEVDLLAALVMAEAGNQDKAGKRLVVDVVLNRIASPSFPNTLHEVVYQPYQFTPTANGMLFHYPTTQECYEAVYEELERQTDTEIVFFNTGGFPSYGRPAYKYGAHYFSYLKGGN